MMSLRLVAVGAALGLVTMTGTGSAAAADEQTPVSILQAGAEQGVADGYPGVIGLISHGGTTRYVHAGVGDLTTMVPADPQAKFRIGSNTKAFAATVLLQLESEGRLSLDDTVAEWLPGAVDANGWDGSEITVRQLLNHTAGLPDYTDDPVLSASYFLNSDPYKAWSAQSLVDIALKLRGPENPPGEKFGYSNTDYVLAGMVIKAVTGNDPATEIRNRIIEPLGLEHTTFPTDPTMHGNYLRGYKYRLIWGIQDVTVSNVQLYRAAGAMVSTLDDMATFLQALLSGRLLPPAQMAELKTTVPMNDAGTVGYGLGIAHAKLPCGQWAWEHTGGVLGYFSEWLAAGDGSKVVIHANNENHLQPGTNGKKDTGTAAVNAYCAAP